MTLLAPLFLLGLLAVGLPWWLHRLNLDKPPEREFASTMLLEPADSLSSQETRLRFRWLFSLRTLLLALLALLFAQPVFKQLSAIVSDARAQQLIVIDTSFSQNLEGRWERTLDIARQLLDDAAAGDSFRLIAASAQLRQLDADGSLESAREAINTLQPDLTRLDYGRIANAIEPLINASQLPVHVHLISDLQASAMPKSFSDLNIDNAASFTLHSTASADDSNTSISARLLGIRDQRASLAAVITNNSDATLNTKVSVFAGGSELASKDLSLQPNTSTTHQFGDLDTREAGDHLELRLAGSDALADDNRALLALPAQLRSDVAVLQASQNSLASLYLSAAIESDPRFAATELRLAAISSAAAGSLLLIPDAAALSDSHAADLQDYLENGGNALIAAGARPHSVRMRGLLNESAAPSINRDRELQPLRVAQVDSTHPVIAGQDEHWRDLIISQRTRLQLDEQTRVIASLSDGAPLLIEREIGKGTMLLLSTALDSSWSNLAVSPVFVAFALRSLEYLSDDFSIDAQRAIGETLSVSGGTQVLDPAGESMRALADLSQRASIELNVPGIYTVENALGSRYLAVGIDPRESDITTIDDNIQTQWRAVGDNSEQPSARDNSAAASNEITEESSSIHRWLLPLLALLVFLEALFSHRHLWIRREA